MTLSSLGDPALRPDETQLQAVLGAAMPLWHTLIARVQAEHTRLEQEWAHAGKSFGWSLRLVQKKRRLLYMIPGHDHFLAAIVLGDRALAMALASEIPEPIKDQFRAARRYAEGTGIRIPVDSMETLEARLALLRLKVL